MINGEIFYGPKVRNDDEAIVQINFKDQKENHYLEQLPKSLQEKVITKFKKHQFLGDEGENVVFENAFSETALIILGMGEVKDFSLIKLRNTLADFFRKIASQHFLQLSLQLSPNFGKNYFEIGKQIGLAFYSSNYHFVQFKSKEAKNKIKYLLTLNLVGSLAEKDKNELLLGAEYARQISEGLFLARDLVNQPASHVTPEVLMQTAFQIEKDAPEKIKVEILDKDECKKLGMNAYLSVAQGSDQEPKFIILHHLPAGKVKKKICLIGKSVTFDTGGISLKPSSGMEEMKTDMAGGAAVLGVFQVLAENNQYFENIEVWGILPACENMPSGKAVHPGDVVTAFNGKTIEIINTDAEGRMTLADTLSYVEKNLQPDLMIDLATLTGACIIALGKKITAMLGNKDKFLTELEIIFRHEGEDVWKLPLFKPYFKNIKSEIADLKNASGRSAGGGTITAALFLAEFVKKTPWVHLDIAGPSYNTTSSDGIMPSGGTGWGVITLLEFLKNQNQL